MDFACICCEMSLVTWQRTSAVGCHKVMVWDISIGDVV